MGRKVKPGSMVDRSEKYRLQTRSMMLQRRVSLAAAPRETTGAPGAYRFSLGTMTPPNASVKRAYGPMSQ